MLVTPECINRRASFSRRLELRFRLKTCRKENFFNFYKRLKQDKLSLFLEVHYEN